VSTDRSRRRSASTLDIVKYGPFDRGSCGEDSPQILKKALVVSFAGCGLTHRGGSLRGFYFAPRPDSITFTVSKTIATSMKRERFLI
jgi:hypothetical protein